MKTILPILSIFLVVLTLSSEVKSQTWKHLRAANTGVCGEEHNFISSDRFGNIWTNGRSIGFIGESSVVRFNWADTIFTCWSDFEGYLPSEFINDAEIDSLDILWVATGDGLCRYDGSTWQTFDMSNTPLPSQNIRSVSFDHSGNVWISFQEINFNIGGVAKYDGANWSVYTPDNSSLPHHECKDVLVLSDNSVWIQSQFSLTHFNGLVFSDFDYQNSPIPGIQIDDAFVDINDKLFIVSQGPQFSEVSIFDGQSWSSMNSSNTPYFENSYYHTFYKRGDSMILGGSNGGFVALIFDGLDWSSHISLDPIFDVHIDPAGTFWVATMSSISHLTNDGWKDYERYNTGISEDFNENIFIDSQNRFWSANGNGGIHVFDCPKWQAYGPFNQQLYPSPQSLSTVGSTICEDSLGNIWFAYNSTSGTIVKVPNGNYQDYSSWEVYDQEDFPISYVEESVADGHGNVFFYSDYGTFMYSNTMDDWQFWDLTNSPLQYYSYGFGTDNNGTAYFGGFQQIAYFDNGVWGVIDLTSVGDGFLTVSDIAFDVNNIIYIATDKGLWKNEGGLWSNWNTVNSNIIADNITSVTFSQNGELWVSGFTAAGFLNGGVGKFDSNLNSWVNLTASNSLLPAEQIDDIEFDLNNNLWINAYPKGISIYNATGLVGFECMNYDLQGLGGVSTLTTQPSITEEFVLFPNPSNDFISLKITGDFYSQNIVLVNGLGQKVMYFPIPNGRYNDEKITIAISELSDGYYTLLTPNGGASSFLKSAQ